MSVNLTSFPFDSQITDYDESGKPIYDRAVNSDVLAAWLGSFFSNGVFGSSSVSVAAGGGMKVNVGALKCLINGRYGALADTEELSIAAADSNYPRIDTVVLRMNSGTSVRAVVLDVITGTAAASPVAPVLTRTSAYWELGIANITIPARATGILDGNIQITVLDSERCGIVAQAMTTLETQYYYNQIISQQSAESARFEAWFRNLQNQLDDNQAAHLQNEIDALDSGKADGSTLTTATLRADGWVGSAAPYTYTLSVTGVTATSAVEVLPGASVTAEQLSELQAANIQDGGQSEGSITLKAFGEKPTTNLPIRIIVRGDL